MSSCAHCLNAVRALRYRAFIPCGTCSREIHVNCYTMKHTNPGVYLNEFLNYDSFIILCPACVNPQPNALVPVVSDGSFNLQHGENSPDADHRCEPDDDVETLDSTLENHGLPTSVVDHPCEPDYDADSSDSCLISRDLPTPHGPASDNGHNANELNESQIPTLPVLESNLKDSLNDDPASTDVPQYQILVGASKRNKDVLVDKIGFQYTIKVNKADGTRVWRCSRRPQKNPCPCTILETDGHFTKRREHSCSPKPGVEINIELLARAKNEGKLHRNQPAAAIAQKELTRIMVKHGRTNLPRLDNVARAINNSRAKEKSSHL